MSSKAKKKSLRIASALSAIALGFGSQLLIPKPSLTQTAGVTVGTPSFTILDDGCIVGGGADGGDTITIATNLTNTTGTSQAFRVVFRATANLGGTTRNLSEDLFYGGPTHMNRVVVGATWDDSYGQVTNTPRIANGGTYTVKTNFGLHFQQLDNTLGLSPNGSTNVTFRAEIFSSDYSVYHGTAAATTSVTHRAFNSCTSRANANSPILLTASKTNYATTDTATIEWSTLGANELTDTPSTTTGSKLPSYGDTTNGIVDIIRLDTPPTGDPETDFANNSTRIVRTLLSTDWSRNPSVVSGSKVDEDFANTSFYHSQKVGAVLTAETNYASFAVSSLTSDRYYLVRLRSRLGANADTSAGTGSHPIMRPQYTYFAVGNPTPLGASADLSISKTDNQTTASPGSPISYTITVTNNGPNEVVGATVTDTVPSTITGVSWTCVASAGSSCGAASGTGNINTTVNLLNGGTATYTLNGTLSATATGTVSNTATVAVPSGITETNSANNSNTDTDTITQNISISGIVFDDVNYGGGAGRNYTTANTSATSSGFATGVIRRQNVRVELYNAAGNYLTATTTDANGAYVFNNQPINATYTVRVVNNTVTSARASSGGTLIPVQTYRTDASTGSAVAISDRVGGENPTLVDAGNGSAGTTLNTTTGLFTAGISGQAQSITKVVAATSNITGIDFGFNFDTIVSIRDSGQGSLRQFIINSNALNNTSLAQVGVLSGREESIFMLSDGTVHPGLRAALANQFSNGVATITVATALPTITGANAGRTSIDGRTQTALTGDTNSPVFNVTTGPEIIIDATTGAGLQVNAGSTFIKNIGITGANGAGTTGVGVYFNGSIANGSRIENATVFNHDNSGVFLGNGTTNVTVLSNIIRNNGITDPLADGIELNNASSNFLQENSILNNPGYGIDLNTTTNNSNRIEGNQIINNGSPDDAQDAGIGIRVGSNNIIGQNTIANNLGDGIVIVSGTGNTITENSIYDNGGLGIDLGGSTEGDNVTVNDSGDGDTGANDLLNFPVIEKATLSSTSLLVTGFARPGARIEFFIKAPDPSGFGEGQTYLITYVEGSGNDSDSTTGTYTSPFNGVNRGTDTTNRFKFAIPLNSLSTTINNTDKITATATCLTADNCNSATNGSTSEFSGSLTVTSSPLISLVKRITAVNGVSLVGFDGDPNDPNGNSNTNEDVNWPLPLATYLPGKIHVDAIKPGDEVEYTIYFLNNHSPATNITICDPVPDHQTFIVNGYNTVSPHPTDPNALPTDTGIAIALDATTLPTNPTAYLTNANDSDRGRYYLPNFAQTPATCQSNANGAIVVNVVNNTTNLPNSTNPGTPTNSYGFIRFKVKVN